MATILTRQERLAEFNAGLEEDERWRAQHPGMRTRNALVALVLTLSGVTTATVTYLHVWADSGVEALVAVEREAREVNAATLRDADALAARISDIAARNDRMTGDDIPAPLVDDSYPTIPDRPLTETDL